MTLKYCNYNSGTVLEISYEVFQLSELILFISGKVAACNVNEDKINND